MSDSELMYFLLLYPQHLKCDSYIICLMTALLNEWMMNIAGFGSFEEPHLLVWLLLRQTCPGVMGKAFTSLLWFVLTGSAELS